MNIENDRQWFVYFKETELGPFSEPVMVQKIKTGEFDQTAFVFTDGMSDWELVKDTRLQKIIESQGAETIVKEPSSNLRSVNLVSDLPVEAHQVEAHEAVETHEINESIEIVEPSATATSSEVLFDTSTPRRMDIKVFVVAAFTILLGIGYYFNRDLVHSLLQPKNKVMDLSQSRPSDTQMPQMEQNPEINWPELDAFVKIQDPQGPAFRIANKTLAGMRPVIIGAISPLLKMNKVTIAVYPDSERSLYVVPPVWMSTVEVRGGYFSAGPLLNSGDDLEPGTYKVMLASQGKFLGDDVGFDLGSYPIGDALIAKQAQAQSQISSLAAKEKSEFKSKLQTLETLYQKAQALEPLAVGKKTKRPELIDQRSQILKELAALKSSQQNLVVGASFISKDQNLLLASVRSLESYLEGLEQFSLGGAENVKVKLNSTLLALKDAATKSWQITVSSFAESEAVSAYAPLQIDPTTIKTKLLESSK